MRDPSEGASESAVSGLDHVQLAIRIGGEAAARAFYGDLLGLTEVAKPEPIASRGGCWFIGPGGIAIHLGADENFRPARKAHIALVVRDPDALRTRLRRSGVETRDDDAMVGVRRFYALDPFGNRLELVDERDARFTERQRERQTGSPPR